MIEKYGYKLHVDTAEIEVIDWYYTGNLFWVTRFLKRVDKESDKIAINAIKTYKYWLISVIFHIKKRC